MNNNRLVAGIGVVLISALSISFSNVLAPIVYSFGSNSYTLLILRYVAFLLFCGIWIWAKKKPFRLNRDEIITCYGAGLAYAIGSGALLGSFAYMPVGLAVLVFFIFPFFTHIIENALDRQWPNWPEVFFLFLSFVGLALALRIDSGELNTTGIGLATLAALGVSSAYVWTGRRESRMWIRV